MSIDKADERGGDWGVTALHLVGALILFIAINFIIGTAWASIAPAGRDGSFVMSAIYGVLTYGVALWCALEGPRRFLSRSRIGTVATVAVAVALVGAFIRLYAVGSIMTEFAPSNVEARNFVWISIVMIAFQTLCSLVAIWLFYRRGGQRQSAGL